MKKIILLALALFSTGQVLAKDANFQFVGITLSRISSDFRLVDTKNDAALGIRYGLQSTQWRTMVALEKDYRGYKAASFETDYLFNTLDLEEVRVKPYIGASVGYYDHDENDDNHAIFGMHTGLIVNISHEVDFDFGLNYKRKRNQENVDNVKQFVFAVHYFF